VQELPFTEYKDIYVFKHPGEWKCAKAGECGLIIRRFQKGKSWRRELSTNDEDYKATGVHYHDIISADHMCVYTVESGQTADGGIVSVAGCSNWWDTWLPHITDWKFVEECIAYDISDYVVAKLDYRSVECVE
jgi:hypothetical protein